MASKIFLVFSMIAVFTSAHAATLSNGSYSKKQNKSEINKITEVDGELVLESQLTSCRVHRDLANDSGYSLEMLEAAARRPGVNIHCQRYRDEDAVLGIGVDGNLDILDDDNAVPMEFQE